MGWRSGPYAGAAAGASAAKGGSTDAGFGSRNPSCKVHVCNLAYSVTWQDLKDHFSSAGTVTYTKILVDKNKGKGKGANPDGWSKGLGMVEFSTPEEAQIALASLHGSELKGRVIELDAWINYDTPAPTWKGEKGAGSKGGKEKGGADWASKGSSKGKGEEWTLDSRSPDCKIFVADLPYSTTWQDLKDAFSQVGTVTYTKILFEKGKGGKSGKGAQKDGWSRGMGIVEFSSAHEAKQAIQTMDGSTIGGRNITVDAWTTGKPLGGA
mmetsp:Transcript_6413/g.13136  ORF Transcript_6413/g.13136 Transcript_6413/m.13136 type:complete len:267 (-) Transcript_6413:139-939(-)